ncbi:MAG: NADPH-dependent glutamate synthase [Marinifilaceae bacterium]|jgi:glutamate synthase (NADPH/NADH) small chain|nr:NADPH-dependent glutamate synthase [Marinifilaceae bacterium]
MTKEEYKEIYNQEWRKEVRKSVSPKERMAIPRVVMPTVPVEERIHSQRIEVNKGLSLEAAQLEAKRCLDCADPGCMKGCPVGMHIPTFIKNLERGNLLEAAKTAKSISALPAVCGRVCPQEKQCEAQCIYHLKLNKPAVSIGNIERFIADWERESGNAIIPEITEKNGIKIAIIGSGPSGLACAGDLAKLGYDVTVFEALHEIGGVLKYGIPEFCLPNYVVDAEIDNLKALGIKFVPNFVVGVTATIDELREEGFKAFYVATGAGVPKFMNIPGENYNGILSANEYLMRINLMDADDENADTPILTGKNVVVVGGGNTAIDAVRAAKRLGAERSIIVYRRSMDEMPARLEEIHHAQDEGIEFYNLANPIEYLADETGRVNTVRVQMMELGEPDESGRRRPVAIEGNIEEIDCSVVVVAIGVDPNPIIPNSVEGLKTSDWGTIEVDDEKHSSVDDIFAGGDIVRGAATVILAMGDGREAAVNIDKKFKSEK